MFIYVGSNVNPSTIKNVFGKIFISIIIRSVDYAHQIMLLIFSIGKNSVNEITDVCYNLPNLETPSNEALHDFINTLNEEKPFNPTIQIIRYVEKYTIT